MICHSEYLSEGDLKVTLDIYSIQEEKCTAKPMPAMIILPGGAYAFLSDRESEPIAKRFSEEGFKCFVLNYTVMPNGYFPTPLKELSLAVVHVRENAEKYGVDPDRIILCGFSAGGHLAASLGTMWHTDTAKPCDSMTYGMNKPNGMILAYPWLTLVRPYNHEDCTVQVCKGDATDEKRRAFSPYLHVSDKTPPAYIWSTADDTCVPVQNSLLFAAAMSEYNIPYELHIFPAGDHGLSLADYRENDSEDGKLLHPDVMTWTAEAAAWCKSL